MSGIPQLREAGWFITGRSEDPVRHLLLRLEERADGSGIWTVELHLCHARRGEPAKTKHEYDTEADARTAVQTIYALSHHLVDLPTWDHTETEAGRWVVRRKEPTKQDLQLRGR